MAYIPGGSKFPFKCKTCGNSFPAGADFWYLGRKQGGRCRGCQEALGRVARARSTEPTPNYPPVPYVAYNGQAELDALLPANTGDETNVIREWASMGAYVQTAKDAPTFYTKSKRGKIDFEGDESWGETIARADNGYVDVRPEVDAMTDKISAHIAPTLQPAFEMFFDVSGGMVDVGRYLVGEPECMVETRLVEIAKPGRVVTILIHGGMLGSVSTADFIKRGVAIVALVESLERMQHSTEIWLEVSSSMDGEWDREILTHLIKLKDASDVLDVDSLMFAVAYPGRHRRISFAVRELERVEFGMRVGVTRDSGGQGKTCPLRCGERVGADIELESLSTFSKVTQDAEAWIKDQLAEIGLMREEQ